MDAEQILGPVASTWAVAMAVSPALQIRAMRRQRSSDEVSITYFAVLLVGFVLWAAYGWSIDNMVLFIPNVLASLIAAFTIGVARSYR